MLIVFSGYPFINYDRDCVIIIYPVRLHVPYPSEHLRLRNDKYCFDVLKQITVGQNDELPGHMPTNITQTKDYLFVNIEDYTMAYNLHIMW